MGNITNVQGEEQGRELNVSGVIRGCVKGTALSYVQVGCVALSE